jgi:ankyrin repeat protein
MANFLFIADKDKKSQSKFLEEWVVENWYGKDADDNNPLHYAYLSDLPDIRQILRQSKLDDT